MDYIKIYNEWLTNDLASGECKKELKSIENDNKEIEYRFGKELEFGTAGMRGILGYGTNEMNIYTVRRATVGLANYILSLGKKAAKRGVAISYDTRRNSDVFAKETAGVLMANGIKVYLYNQGRPVPMLSFALRHFNCIAGVMITASHNPKEYNGYKVYGEDGAQMSPENTNIIVDYISKCTDYFNINTCYKTGEGFTTLKGLKKIDKNFDKIYVNTLAKYSISKKEIKAFGKNLKIVYTPVHGTGYVPMTALLKKLKLHFVVVEDQIKPDPDFSTVKVPNPELPETLSHGMELANKIKADIVFGTDPDSDRLGVAIRNENGEFINLTGNQVGALLTDYVLKRLTQVKKLKPDAFVVKSFVSTDLVKSICKGYNVELRETPVGFKFIGEQIKKTEEEKKGHYVFGFEESCGYLLGTHARDKDAVVAGMLFAEMVCYYSYHKISIFSVLNDIYNKFGFYEDKTISNVYSGLSAMDEMSKVVEKARNTDIKSIGIYNVVACRDYLTGERKDSFGNITKLDYSNLNCLYYELEIGGFVCLRPSGTEPKLKIYYSVKGNNLEDTHNIIKELNEGFNKIIGE